MDIVKTSLIAGLLLVMFAQGMHLHPSHLLGYRRVPGALARAFIAVDVLVPLAAFAALALFRPGRPVAIGLALMAASPMAALGLTWIVRSPKLRQTWSGIYFILLVAAVVTTPLTLHLMERAVSFEARVSPAAIGFKVLWSVVLPVAAGMFFLRIRPRVAIRAARPLQKSGMLLIALSVVSVVAARWRALADFGFRDYLAVALFVVLSLTFGHLLGGEDADARTLLATESATRNPALALLIAETSAPHTAVAAVLVPYLVTFLVLTNAYRLWKRHKPSSAGTRSKMTTSPP